MRHQVYRQAADEQQGWTKYPGNPVIGKDLGTCFDMSVDVRGGRYRMWFSWRPKHGIGYAESPDGLHWSVRSEIVLGPDLSDPAQELEVTRPFVLVEDGQLTMWYSAHGRDGVVIARALSKDGLSWQRQGSVLEPELPWEKASLMCPSVLQDGAGRYHMWYSGGERYEPDAIGYAVSADGIAWSRASDEPVLRPGAPGSWEASRVTGAHVFRDGDWLYAAYIGFAEGYEDSSIGIARSSDGLSWDRHANNPVIVRGKPGEFDSINVYKPFVIVENGLWRVWFNGSSPLVSGDSSPANRIEQIGHAACRFVFEPENADAD